MSFSLAAVRGSRMIRVPKWCKSPASRAISWREPHISSVGRIFPEVRKQHCYTSSQKIIHLTKWSSIIDISLFLHDIEARLDELPSPTGMTDPFVSIYQIVYQLTMRQVGCTELASDIKRIKHTLSLYGDIEKSTNAVNIIFPWLPTFALLSRTIAGGKLYFTFKKIINDRKKTGRRENDALQHLIDMDDSMNNMLQVRSSVAPWFWPFTCKLWFKLTRRSSCSFLLVLFSPGCRTRALMPHTCWLISVPALLGWSVCAQSLTVW